MELTGFFIVAPSTVTVGEPFDLRIRILCKPYVAEIDKYNIHRRHNWGESGISTMEYLDNTPVEWPGSVTIQGSAGYSGPRKYTFCKGCRPIACIGPMSFDEAGVKFLTVRDPQSGLKATSNPVLVNAGPLKQRLFWGDIHCHTFYSDGVRSPEQVCQFARDEAFLDIFAMTDHGGTIKPNLWKYYSAVTNEFYEPGRFVTFHGQEWEHAGAAGHLNVYYPGDNASPCIHQSDRKDYPRMLADARKYGGLVIHHHSAAELFKKDWSLPYDPEVQRLIEIYSVWGNSERLKSQGNPRPIRVFKGEKEGQHVLDALKRGCRFGFIGGGDIHDGRPGDELHTFQRQMYQFGYDKLYRQGIMGVWAKELTREAIFQAMMDRSVYATTNERIILRFSINGHQMGSEIPIAEGDLDIRVEAYSDVPIDRIDMVKDGKDLETIKPRKREVNWTLQDVAHAKNTTWYYARVSREDGEMAWSSRFGFREKIEFKKKLNKKELWTTRDS